MSLSINDLARAFYLGMLGLDVTSTLSLNDLAVAFFTAYPNGIALRQATTAAAPTYAKGAWYFDTTLNKLRVGGATAWETVTSA